MTCIVGLEHEGRVFIGGDSAGVGGLSLQVRADAKVFVNGPFVMGFTSSFRMGQLLRYSLKASEQLPSQKDDHEFLVTTFVNDVRQCLKDGGYVRVDSGVERGGTFLVGYHGALYSVQDDFQVARCARPYDAVGCGDDVALGAMGALDPLLEPTVRIERALEITEQHSAGVRGPFRVVSA